uniref:Uncharacterized protein n=1 Tax=Anguilla anguilla TaxID=7936 RepID=A0A0E9SMI0_ANGAN
MCTSPILSRMSQSIYSNTTAHKLCREN